MCWKKSRIDGPEPNVNWESPKTRMSGELNLLADKAGVDRAAHISSGVINEHLFDIRIFLRKSVFLFVVSVRFDYITCSVCVKCKLIAAVLW